MRILLYLLCIFSVTITFSACQKEFEDPGMSVIPPVSSLDTFKVNIDGAAFPTYGISTINALNTIILIASDMQAVKRVSLTVPANITPGSYPLDFFGTVYFGIYYRDTLNFLVSNPGKISIIENNLSSKRIRGTFDFNAEPLNGGNAMSILTSGYFSVKYS